MIAVPKQRFAEPVGSFLAVRLDPVTRCGWKTLDQALLTRYEFVFFSEQNSSGLVANVGHGAPEVQSAKEADCCRPYSNSRGCAEREPILPPRSTPPRRATACRDARAGKIPCVRSGSRRYRPASP